MSSQFIAAAIALIALGLGAVQARAQLMLFRADDARSEEPYFNFATMVTLGAWIINGIWAFYSWQWYWAALAITIALATANIVTARSLGMWIALRYLVAIATTASAGLLWGAYRPGP